MAQHGLVEATDEYEIVTFAGVPQLLQENDHQGKHRDHHRQRGHGAPATDMLFSRLQSPHHSARQNRQIRDSVSATTGKEHCIVHNPVDLTGSSTDDDFVRAALALSRNNNNIECIIMLLLPYIPDHHGPRGPPESRLSAGRQTYHCLCAACVDKYNMLIEGFTLNNMPVAQVHMAEAMRRYGSC